MSSNILFEYAQLLLADLKYEKAKALYDSVVPPSLRSWPSAKDASQSLKLHRLDQFLEERISDKVECRSLRRMFWNYALTDEQAIRLLEQLHMRLEILERGYTQGAENNSNAANISK
jgi:hypothetical protein